MKTISALLASSLLLVTAPFAGAASGRECAPSEAVKELLTKTEAAGNPLDALTAENAGALWMQRELAAKKILKAIPIASVKDIAVPARNHQVPVRVYDPRASKGRKLPTLVFFHGGGWTIGSLATYDNLARALAAKIPAVVVSVDYRLAPEHPYPAGVEDSRLAFDWAWRNLAELGGDPARVGVAGDSGGGNLATVVARHARAEGVPLRLQALFYPSVNLNALDTPSFTENEKGFLLTKRSVEAFRDLYVPKAADRANPDVSPLLAPEKELGLLPPTYLLLVGCDPLRDEGFAYGEKLRAQGVKVSESYRPEFVHGFLGFFNNGGTPKLSKPVEKVIDEMGAWMKKEFSNSSRAGN